MIPPPPSFRRPIGDPAKPILPPVMPQAVEPPVVTPQTDIDPRRFTDPALREAYAPRIKELDAAEATVARQQADTEKEQQRAQREALKQQNTDNEIRWANEGRPTILTSDGVLRPKHDDATWQAMQEAKQAKTALADANKQMAAAFKASGQKSFVNPATGALEATESPEDAQARLAKETADATEKARRALLGQQINSLGAELATVRPVMSEAERRKNGDALNKMKRDVLSTKVVAALNAKVQELDKGLKGSTWNPFDNKPELAQQAEAVRGQAEAINKRLFEGGGKGPVDITPEEEALLDEPLRTAIQKQSALLAQHDERSATHADLNARQQDARLRLIDPAKWEQKQLQRIGTLPDDQLDGEIEQRRADLESKQEALRQKKDAQEQASAGYAQRFADLEAQNEQVLSQGVRAGDVMELSLPDGSKKTFARPLAAQYFRLQQEQAAHDKQVKETLPSLMAEDALHQQDMRVLNAAIERKNAVVEGARSEQLNQLRANPVTAPHADAIDALDREAQLREADLSSIYPPGSAEHDAAAAALREDVRRQHEGILQSADASKRMAAADKQNKIKAALGENDALVAETKKLIKDVGSTDIDSGLLNKMEAGAVKRLAQKTGVDGSTAKTLLDDARKLDWRGTGAADFESDPVTKGLKWIGIKGQPGTFYADAEPTRMLSDGSLTVNPALIARPEQYAAAVKASGASDEAQKAAMDNLPSLREQLGRQALEAFQKFPGSGFEEFVKTQSGKDAAFAKLPPEEQAAAYADKVRSEHGALGQFTRAVYHGLVSGVQGLGEQALGVGAMLTGSEAMAQAAAGINESAGNRANFLQVTGGSDTLLNRAAGATAQTAPSVAVSMAGGRIAQSAVGLLARTSWGAERLAAIAAGIKGAKTAQEAIQSIQSTTGLLGAAAAGGAQTAGSQFAEIYSKLRGDGMSHEEALSAARGNAVAAGLVTAFLTTGFGKTGVERIFAEDGKELVKTRFTKILSGMGFGKRATAITTGVVEGAAEELPEELLDEAYSQVTGNISQGQSLPEAVASFVKTLPELVLSIGALGGVGGGIHGYAETRPVPVVPEVHRRPEIVAAAKAGIESYVDTPDSPVTKANAAAVLRLAQGEDISKFASGELAALGLDRKDGKIVPLKAAEGSGQKSEGQIPIIEFADTEHTQPIIRQEYIDALDAVLPAVHTAVGMDEVDAREMYAERAAQAEQVPVEKAGPVEAAGETSPPDVSATSAASLSGVKDSGAIHSVAPGGGAVPEGAGKQGTGQQTSAAVGQSGPPKGNTPARRAWEVANHLEERGMDRSTAQRAAGQLVAKAGVVGDNVNAQIVDDSFAATMKALGFKALSKGRWEASKSEVGSGKSDGPAATGTHVFTRAGIKPVDYIRQQLADKKLSAIDAARKVLAGYTGADPAGHVASVLGMKPQAARDVVGVLTTSTNAASLNPPQGGQTVSRQAHNLENAGSNPAPATTTSNAGSRPSTAELHKHWASVKKAIDSPTRNATVADLARRIREEHGLSTEEAGKVAKEYLSSGLNRAVATDAAADETDNLPETMPEAKAAAVAALPRGERKRARTTLKALDKALAKQGKAFDQVIVGAEARARLKGSAVHVSRKGGKVTLFLDVPVFIQQHAWLARSADEVADTMSEEFIHAVALHLTGKDGDFSDRKLAQLWHRLPQDLKNAVWQAYHARAVGKRKSRAIAPALDVGASAVMTHEFLRMLVQNRAFRGRVTEHKGIDTTGLLPWIKRLLSKLGEALEHFLGLAPKDVRADVERYRAKIIAAMADFEGAHLAAESGTDKTDKTDKTPDVDAILAHQKRGLLTAEEAEAEKLRMEKALAENARANASDEAKATIARRLIAQAIAARILKGESDEELAAKLKAGAIDEDDVKLARVLVEIAQEVWMFARMPDGSIVRRENWNPSSMQTREALELVGIGIAPRSGRLYTMGASSMAYVHQGRIIIRQRTLDALAKQLPITRQLIRMDENEARQVLGLPANAQAQTLEEVETPPTQEEPPPVKSADGNEDDIDMSPGPLGQTVAGQEQPAPSETPAVPPPQSIDIGKREYRRANFATVQDAEAFNLVPQLRQAHNPASKLTEAERTAIIERGRALRNRLVTEAGHSKAEANKILEGYHAAVIEEAKKADPFDGFTPQSFERYARFPVKEAPKPTVLKTIAKDKLKDPTGGNDLISILKGEIGRLGFTPESYNSAEWEWYRALEQAAKSSGLNLTHAKMAAARGEVDDPRALLEWVNQNIVNVDGGRAIDEAAEELNSGDFGQTFEVSATELGPTILDAVRTRQAALEQPETLDDFLEAEGEALLAAERAAEETERIRSMALGAAVKTGEAEIPGIPRTIIDRAVEWNNRIWSKLESLTGVPLSRFFAKPDTDVVFLVKPIGIEMDGVRKLEAFIQRNGGIIADRWRGRVSKERMEQHYAEHAGKPFFPKLTGYYQGREVVAYRVKVRGDQIPALRAMVGKSSVPKSENSLRGSIVYAGEGADEGWNNLFTDPNLNSIDNGIHLSDSPEAGRRESEIWFSAAAKSANQPPPATPDIEDVLPGLPREIARLTESARRHATVMASEFLPDMRKAARKAGLRFLSALAQDAVAPRAKSAVMPQKVPDNLLRTTLQDGRTLDELLASVERLLPALRAGGYRIATDAKGEPLVSQSDEEVALSLVQDSDTMIDPVVKELRIATPALIRRRASWFGDASYRVEKVVEQLKERWGRRSWAAELAAWEPQRPASASSSASASEKPSATILRPMEMADSRASMVTATPDSISSPMERLLHLAREVRSAARLSSSERARYFFKVSSMPEDTRFSPDSQGEYQQPTLTEKQHLTLDELMMDSGGGRELSGPHAAGLERVLRLGGRARRAVVGSVWSMMKSTYAEIGLPYRDADALLAEAVLFDVAMDEVKPVAYALVKPGRYGYKTISFGHDGSRAGKDAVHAFIARQKTPGYWAELSDAPERSARRQGVPAIKAETAVTMVKRARLLETGDGTAYERTITGLPEPHVKTVFGRPWNTPSNSLVPPRFPAEMSTPQALFMAKKVDDGLDLFTFDFGAGSGKLFSNDERPRPASRRPAKPALAADGQKPAPEPGDFGELFARPGLGGTAGGNERPMGDGSGSGQPAGGGTGGNDAAGGGEVGGAGSDTGTTEDAQGGTDGSLSGLPGDVESADAGQVFRPDVGDPARNFEAPADVASLAPATDRAKIAANIAAIRLLKELEGARRNATEDEKRVLSQYTGWGAFKEAFNSKYENDIATHWDGKPEYQRRYMPEWLQSWERNHRALHKLLKESMTEAEFASASASTLNAHYTAAPIIRSMWKMVQRLGFTGGRVLEPSAGAGHFVGLQPRELADRSRWQAVELDDITARLFSKLYPEVNINEHTGGNETREVEGLGFERARIPNGSIDLLISNVPFHESGPRKKGFPKLNLHNFFFAHALDKVKPGGLVAFITSDSTMQNNIRQRDFLASKGDLVAAFRLPNNAFKGNAGTEVTTDIIILRKPDGTPFKGQAWRNLVEVGRQILVLKQGDGETADELRAEAARTGEIIKETGSRGNFEITVSAPIMVNEYFVNHPQNVLGRHTLEGTMYRAGQYAVVAPDGLDVMESLDALIASLPADVMGRQSTADQKDVVLAGKEDKPFSFKEQDGKIYEVQPDGSMEEAEWGTNPELVKTWRSWSRVRDAIERLVTAENSAGAGDDEIERLRRELNLSYDTHIATYKPISRRRSNNHRHLYSDPSYPLTAALENEKVLVDPKTGKKTYTYPKADIFKKRIGRPIVLPTKAKTIDEALEMSLAWRGHIDSAWSASLLDITPAAFERDALQRADIFENPQTSMLEVGAEYLSGNIRVKLEAAEEAAKDNPKFQKNVRALRDAMPERKGIGGITPILGARWIPASVYNAFIREVLNGSDTVEYVAAGNTWIISGTGIYRSEEMSTDRKGAASLFKHALDMTEPVVRDRLSDGSSQVNHRDTAAARAVLDKMKRAFLDFAKTSEAMVAGEDGEPEKPVWQVTEDAFNETNNSYVNPKHTGEYLTFPGLNTDYVYTRAHRRAVIARFLSARRGMMAHGVGSGKTFNQIILSYEMRRLGLARKPMIVVQNATLGQFARSYLKAYPSAKILVPTKDDFKTANRRKLVAKIATGDWDAVILPHSQFDLISNKPEAVKAYMDGQIQELYELVTKEKDKAKVRDLEGMLKRLRDKRQSMLDALAERQDVAIFWEDLGVDALIMDEAHNYKGLPIVTRMGRVKGVPTSGDSQRGINFMLKARDVQAKTGGKNIFLATGTPIKNSMAEAYIMMQFMAPDILADYRIHNFDDFATAFGQMETKPEMSWSTTPKMETRFAKFQNGGALVTMIRTMFDVAMGNEKLGLDVPEIEGGEPEMKIVPATAIMQRFNAWTRSIDALWKNATPEEKEEYSATPIQVMGAGIAASLDPRLISPNAIDDPESKVNVALREVIDIYKKGTPKRTTQVIFSDLRNPFDMGYILPFTGHPFPEHGSEGKFDLFEDIKAKLIAGGIPAKEIHLMESGMTDVAKAALFDKVDNGEVRIIVGSTELLGVGVNIQTRLTAVHHLMPPRDFTPAMMEQRNGRIIRQGNLHSAKVEGAPAWNEAVRILNYGTEGSMDSAIYGTLARKQRFITQLLMDELGLDTFDDPTDPVAINMAEMAARTLGDPDFIRQIELEREIKELRLLSDAFTNELAGRRSRLNRAEQLVRSLPETIAELRGQSSRFENLWKRTAPRPEGVKETTDISDKPVYEFGGQVIDTAGKDGAITSKLDLWLLDQSVTMERQGKNRRELELKINGQPVKIEVHVTNEGQQTPGSIDYGHGESDTYFGAESLIRKLRKAPEWMAHRAAEQESRLEHAKASIGKLRQALDKESVFPQAAELAALEKEMEEVKARLAEKATPDNERPGAPDEVDPTLPPVTPVDESLVTDEVRDVLDGLDVIGNKVFIPDQLERKLYQSVDKALQSAGGRWNRRAKAHVFSGDPREALGLPLAMAQKTGTVDAGAHEAATSPLNPLQEPTEAQKAAGNYKVGRVRVGPLDISIENPAGSVRSGTSRSGKTWSVTMADHYGYVRGTEGKDGDHVDIFIEPGTPEDFSGPVFVINQKNADGSFDEHKAILGPSIQTKDAALAEYLKNYSPGWQGAGGIVQFRDPSHFHQWVTSRRRMAPVLMSAKEQSALDNQDPRPFLGVEGIGDRDANAGLGAANKTDTDRFQAAYGGGARVPYSFQANGGRVEERVFVNNDIALGPGQSVVAAELMQMGGNLYRLSVVKTETGESFAQAEKFRPSSEFPHALEGRFEKLDSSDIERNSTLNDRARRMWEDARASEGQASLFAANKTGDEVNPLARLGWNHLDKAVSAKIAAHTRWARDGVAETVAGWTRNENVAPFVKVAKLVKGELIPDSKLPAEVLAAKREMDMSIAMHQQRSLDLVRALAGKPKFSDMAYPKAFVEKPEMRARLFDAMEGRIPMSSLPVEMQQLGAKLRAMLVKIGQEAVKQGRMSLETFEGLRENFMPRFTRDDAEAKAGDLWKRFKLGVKDILQQRTTAWHIVDTSRKDYRTGQFVTVPWDDKGRRWRFRDQGHRDAFYEALLKREAVHALQTDELLRRDLMAPLEAGEKKKLRAEIALLTVDQLDRPAEMPRHLSQITGRAVQRMRGRFKKEAPTVPDTLIKDPVYAIARYAATMTHDNATAQFFNFVLGHPEYVSDTPASGFTEIPDNDRFGRLAGKHVRDDIAGQILELVHTPSAAVEAYDTILGWWKTGKTVLNPGTHMRNLMGNLFFSQLVGNSLHNPGNLPFYKQAITAIRDGGADYTALYENGVLGADYASTELRGALRGLLPTVVAIDEQPGVLMGIGKTIGRALPGFVKSPARAVVDFAVKAYGVEDDVFKAAAFFKARAMGMDGKAAAEHVRKWFPYFDGGSSSTLRALGRTALPFLGFYRESIRIFGHALKERPIALAAGLAVPSLITLISAMLLGLDDDDLDEVKKDMRGKGGKLGGLLGLSGVPVFSMLLPMRTADGQLQQFDISAIHPFANFFGQNVEANQNEGWYQSLWRSMLAAGPLGSLAYSQMTGRDTFGDRAFVEANMTTAEKVGARLDNAAKTLLPPLAPFGTGMKTLASAGERQTNKTFETRNPGQAVARAVAGVDVRGANPNLYRLADDWRAKNGLPAGDGADFGTTPVSRARAALFHLLAQDEPDVVGVRRVLAFLKQQGHAIDEPKDIHRLLALRNPLEVIKGRENQQRFRSSLHGEARRVLDQAVGEYQRIVAKAPGIIFGAQ